jgi:hypothetical protein
MPAQSKVTTGNKVGTQLLVSPHTKMRAGALALIRQESQAEMFRVLVEASLERFEGAHVVMLDKLHAKFRSAGVDAASAIDVMLKDRIKAHNLIEMDDLMVRHVLGAE